MPKYVYVGEADRYYPGLRLTPQPGEAVDLAEAPNDGRWQATDKAASAAIPAPVKAPEPVVNDNALKAAQAAMEAAKAAEDKAEADLAALQAKDNA